EITDAPNAPDCIRLTISNTGDGIPPEAVPHLFSRYFRASTNETKGYGLGLAICKQNIDMHGGSIEVENVPYEQASFHITLPVGKPYLLVLSADRSLTDRIGERLSESWRTESVETAEECLTSVMAELPTAIFIDNYAEDTTELLAQL